MTLVATCITRQSSIDYAQETATQWLWRYNPKDHTWLAKQLGHSLQMFYTVYADWFGSDDKDQKELEKIS